MFFIYLFACLVASAVLFTDSEFLSLYVEHTHHPSEQQRNYSLYISCLLLLLRMSIWLCEDVSVQETSGIVTIRTLRPFGSSRGRPSPADCGVAVLQKLFEVTL